MLINVFSMLVWSTAPINSFPIITNWYVEACYLVLVWFTLHTGATSFQLEKGYRPRGYDLFQIDTFRRRDKIQLDFADSYA